MDDVRVAFTRITKSGKLYVGKTVKTSDLSPAEVQAVRYVVGRGREGLRQTALCDLMGIDKAAIARLTARLEEKGYVVRESDAQDGRVKRIYALPPANDVKEDAVAAENGYYAWLLDILPQEERAAFCSTLNRLYQRAMEERRAGFSHLTDGEEAR